MKNNKWDLLRRKGAREDKVLVGPHSVEIHLTNACALSCLFCPYHFDGDENYKNPRKNLEFDTFKGIIDDCASLKVDFIVFTGEGDPFSHPQIGSMIPYVKQKGLRLNIDTHALFPGEKIFPLALMVDALNVNIPGVDENSYTDSQFDKKNCFKRATDNVRRLALSKKGQTLKLNWVYVITKKSYPHLSRVLVLAGELGFDTVSFRFAKLLEANEGLGVTAGDLKYLKKEIAAALRINQHIKVKSNILKIANEARSMFFYDECKKDMPANSRSEERRSNYFERGFPEDFSCLVGWYKAYVDLRGDVLLCCANLQTVVGNVYKGSFREIWKAQKATQMRLEMKHQFDLKKDFFLECRTCPYVSVDTNGEILQIEWSKA